MPAVSITKVGIKAVLYYNTGSYMSPTWTPMPSVLDCAVAVAWDKPDASARASLAKLIAKVMLDLGIDIKVRTDDVAADYIALWAALISSTATMDVLVLNGPITAIGARGWRYTAGVTDGPEDQGAGVVIYDNFTLKPVYDSNGYPTSAVVTNTNTVTFTALS